jgi:hypothetical protein
MDLVCSKRRSTETYNCPKILIDYAFAIAGLKEGRGLKNRTLRDVGPQIAVRNHVKARSHSPQSRALEELRPLNQLQFFPR